MPSRLPFFPALAVSVTAAFLFWRWMGAPVALPDVPGNELQCLSYTPFEPGNPGATMPGWVSTSRIENDLGTLMLYTRCLRVYTPLGTTPRVVEAASRRGMIVMLGAWIGRDRDQNEKEIAGALELARRYPRTVPVIVVGNEVLLRREMSAEQLAELITSVREESPVPVAYADVADFIRDNHVVADAADVLLIHLLPYWQDPRPPPVDEAIEQVIRQYKEFESRYFDKGLMIGETGWPSKGRMRGPGKPGLVNQAAFVRGFAARAREQKIPYNLIEAVDQPWKRWSEGTVGGYWGILDAQRTAKFPLLGPVSAWPDWQVQFLATAAVIVMTCLAGLRWRLGVRGWMAWATISLALGLSLVFQWDFVVATRLGIGDWISGGTAAAVTVWAAAQLGRLVAGKEFAAVASLANLGRSLRTPAAILRAASLRNAAFGALVMIPAAWISLTLAFAARYRDVPIAQFLLPALAIAAWSRRIRRERTDDRREEAMLTAILLACGSMQLEMRNLESMAWLGICALLAAPWLPSLGAELARIRVLFADARQPQKNAEHS